jgi:hypothetical protein
VSGRDLPMFSHSLQSVAAPMCTILVAVPAKDTRGNCVAFWYGLHLSVLV